MKELVTLTQEYDIGQGDNITPYIISGCFIERWNKSGEFSLEVLRTPLIDKIDLIELEYTVVSFHSAAVNGEPHHSHYLITEMLRKEHTVELKGVDLAHGLLHRRVWNTSNPFETNDIQPLTLNRVLILLINMFTNKDAILDGDAYTSLRGLPIKQKDIVYGDEIDNSDDYSRIYDTFLMQGKHLDEIVDSLVTPRLGYGFGYDVTTTSEGRWITIYPKTGSYNLQVLWGDNVEATRTIQRENWIYNYCDNKEIIDGGFCAYRTGLMPDMYSGFRWSGITRYDIESDINTIEGRKRFETWRKTDVNPQNFENDYYLTNAAMAHEARADIVDEERFYEFDGDENCNLYHKTFELGDICKWNDSEEEVRVVEYTYKIDASGVSSFGTVTTKIQ